MPLDLKLWNEIFPQGALPLWPCPKCKHGRVSVVGNSQKVMEPSYSKLMRSHEDWEPFWIIERFVAIMKCSDQTCGEIVVVAGDTELVEENDEEFGRGFVTYIRPRSVFPGPPVIAIPTETPRQVAEELDLAFQLYWSDLGASANRLRTSLERLLDDLKIPKTKIDKNQKKHFYRPLASRIGLFAKKKPEYGDNLDALRIVGNLGTHSIVGRQALLAAFEIYEATLAEIYGKRTKKLQKLAKHIKRTKGKLK